jgi:exopolysaccharide biosynthesis WecB/TagA/CpsF family protein
MAHSSDNPQRILLVQIADIGDLILTTPALYALREARPSAHLTLLTTAHSAPLIEPGLVDEVITLDRRWVRSFGALRLILGLRRKRFDAVVFFHHFTLWLGMWKYALIAWAARAPRVIGLDNGRGWFLTERVRDDGFGAVHQARYWLMLVARLDADPTPRRAQVALDGGVLPLAATSKKRVVIHTGSGGYSPARRWPSAYFAQVADALIAQHNAQVVFVGKASDGAEDVQAQMQHKAVMLVDRTSLTQLADVIRSADLYIGADSGVTHLACAVGTPLIAIFGSSSSQAWGPWLGHEHNVVLRSAPLCSPCSYVGHRIGAREGCPARTCMHMVTPQQVIAAAEALLSQRSAPFRPSPVYRRVDAPTVQLLGLPHHWLSTVAFSAAVSEMLRRSTYHQVILTDYDYSMQAAGHPILRTIFERAALVAPSGVGLSWAAGWTRQHLPETLDSAALLACVLREAAKQQRRIFLLGDYAAAAAAVLAQELPGVLIAGALDASSRPEHEAGLVERVNTAQADLLICGWPQMTADLWLARNSSRLRVRAALAIGEPLMRDLAGRSTPIPEALQELRLGWLYLLLREPRRLRALWRAPLFILRVVLRGAR